MEDFDIKKVPAFPVSMSGPCNFGGLDIPKGASVQWGGISMRDYFAGNAIEGACNGDGGMPDGSYCKYIAESAYKLADAMLKARG